MALIPANDPELVALARSGSEKAYRELAEDLAQETFIKVFNHLGNYNPAYKFSSWIFKIASNLAIDSLRRKELATVSIDGSRHAQTADEVESTRITVESRDENPEEALEAKQLGQEIEVAIAALRPEYRTAILLRHVEGRPYEEISEIMGIPLGTVKTYIHRARGELRESLSHLRIEA